MNKDVETSKVQQAHKTNELTAKHLEIEACLRGEIERVREALQNKFTAEIASLQLLLDTRSKELSSLQEQLKLRDRREAETNTKLEVAIREIKVLGDEAEGNRKRLIQNEERGLTLEKNLVESNATIRGHEKTLEESHRTSVQTDLLV